MTTPTNPYTADLAKAEHALSQVPHPTRFLVAAVADLRKMDENGTQPILSLLRANSASTQVIIRDCVDLATIKAKVTLEKILPTEEYQSAIAIVAPLADEVARLTAAAKEWDHAEGRRLAAAREARQAAIDDAMAAAMRKIDSRHPVAEVA
jgi:hypothetical protein